MKKQTQSRQYGYVSPKCKFVRLEQGFCFVASPGAGEEGAPGNNGGWISGGDY